MSFELWPQTDIWFQRRWVKRKVRPWWLWLTWGDYTLYRGKVQKQRHWGAFLKPFDGVQALRCLCVREWKFLYSTCSWEDNQSQAVKFTTTTCPGRIAAERCNVLKSQCSRITKFECVWDKGQLVSLRMGMTAIWPRRTRRAFAGLLVLLVTKLLRVSKNNMC